MLWQTLLLWVVDNLTHWLLGDFKSVISEHMLWIKFMSTLVKLLSGESHRIPLMISQQWCRQATSHNLSWCWPRSMLHYGIRKPLCANWWVYIYIRYIFTYTNTNMNPYIHPLQTSLKTTKQKRQVSFLKHSTPNLPALAGVTYDKIITEGMTASCTWWRHQMETFSTLLALCEGNSPVTGEFPSRRPVTRSFDVFFDLPLE